MHHRRASSVEHRQSHPKLLAKTHDEDIALPSHDLANDSILNRSLGLKQKALRIKKQNKNICLIEDYIRVTKSLKKRKGNDLKNVIS